MSLFIETLRVEPDNSVPLLSYHRARMKQTLNTLDNAKTSTILTSLESKLAKLLLEVPTPSIRKYRLIYTSEEIIETTLTPYQIRPITTLTIAPITFDYSHKFADRIEINSCYHNYPSTDDIIMLKDGYLTDTSYGNVALHLDGVWYTPEEPLLKGCRRQQLLDTGQIKQKKIRIEDLNSYSYLMIFNAMIPFGRLLIPIRHLHYY